MSLAWYASAVHAIALTLSLSLAPAPGEAAPVESSATAESSPAEVEPLPDIAPESEPAPEPEPTPEPTPEPEPHVPPLSDEEALATAVTEPPLPAPAPRDRLGCDGSKPCRKMSVAGIIVGTLGLAATGIGIGLLVHPDEVIPESPIFVTSTHPAGLVAVTIGTGIVLTSALMLGAAHKGYKQGSGKVARVQIGPTGLRF